MIEIAVTNNATLKFYVPSVVYCCDTIITLLEDGSIAGHSLYGMAEHYLHKLWDGASPYEQYIILTVKNVLTTKSISIDTHKLDPDNLRYSCNHQGELVYRGVIPREAIIKLN